MDVFFLLGFIGAWLLFAGPVYQAAIELREEGFDQDDQEEMRGRVAALGRPPHISAWWWLLPPVAFVLNRRRTSEWRMAMLAQMAPTQRERFQSFQNKATGWLTVAMGALCIAAKETGELVHHFEWSAWTLIPLLVAPFLMAVGYTVSRISRERRMRALLEP
ncbi:hypothetical protein [Microbacterium rhizophilus]|uniref:hypothetical protein n=1 Tax=Microbacterium rhizophilus TaxID=3138934 RepID=UPI0031E8D882